MPIVTIRDLTIGFRGPPLLEDVSCLIDPGERIGLLGRNGAGKTTFMRILQRQLSPDHGEVQFAPRTIVTLLPQDVPQDLQGSVRDIVAAGLEVPELADQPEWERDQWIAQILSRMELDESTDFGPLSSGMKRRVLLARSLVPRPQLLLLDEPTNHLDIDAIRWLEDFLLKWPGSLLFVTHDRMFLRRLATRILEIDRGQLFDWSCDYDTFLRRKEAALEAQEKQDALFDKRLAEEERWIRQGIRARRTRNEGRVKALKEMRREHSQRRTDPGQVRLKIQQAERSGSLVAVVENVSFGYGDHKCIDGFSTMLTRGDKVGIVGPNGVGKTTLLKLLLGRLSPQEGTIRLGSNLQIAYFDQLREQLDEAQTVQDNVADGYDTVSIAGVKQHVIGYLQNFLFTPDRARTPVRFLSGGERNRLLLARLFAKPANVIVLDEPTNDLDSETLELLEERVADFDGTVIVVSHDREFLNNVVTSTIVFEAGGLKEYAGGYDDWLRQYEAANQAAAASKVATTQPSTKPAASKTATRGQPSRPPTGRLSFHDKKELAGLPATIERLEEEIATLHEKMAQSDFYQQAGDQIAAAQQKLSTLESELTAAYARWEELEARSY